MNLKEPVLDWWCRSGNKCTVTISEECAQELRLSFTWTQTPNADDREDWRFAIVSEAVARLQDYAVFIKTGVEALRDLEARGELKRVAIDDQGDWLFGPPSQEGER